MLFSKSDLIKKVTSVFHKVEINPKNHTIEIRGINYTKLMQHIKDLYPDQKVYKIFEIIYNPKDWEKYQNKVITKIILLIISFTLVLFPIVISLNLIISNIPFNFSNNINYLIGSIAFNNYSLIYNFKNKRFEFYSLN